MRVSNFLNDPLKTQNAAKSRRVRVLDWRGRRGSYSYNLRRLSKLLKTRYAKLAEISTLSWRRYVSMYTEWTNWRHDSIDPSKRHGLKSRRCGCPIQVEGSLGGESVRKALDLTSWQVASSLIHEWNATGKIGGVYGRSCASAKR